MRSVFHPVDVLETLEEYLNGMLTWCDQNGLTPGEQLKVREKVMHSVSHEKVTDMRDLVHTVIEAIDEDRYVEFPYGGDPMSFLMFTGQDRPRVE